ncbi:hypothetical protein XELAEV_18029855mg [Xenopus laevis]|uniref:Uncharacterized protein n=1 Tax=Xenopus laevis TaxID=8355 RepID=A0A974CU45_XENLA|nr:hypothetical protein XELAEV_18029855mg [Xenopus laevis]
MPLSRYHSDQAHPKRMTPLYYLYCRYGILLDCLFFLNKSPLCFMLLLFLQIIEKYCIFAIKFCNYIYNCFIPFQVQIGKQ